MTHFPLKPIVRRPLEVPLSDTLVAHQLRSRRCRISKGFHLGKSALGSLGFHLCAVAIVCAMAWLETDVDENGAAGESTVAEGFELNHASVSHVSSLAESLANSSAPFKPPVSLALPTPQTLVPFTGLASQSIISPITSAQAVPSLPATSSSPATSEGNQSASPSKTTGVSSSNSSAKSGSGQNQTAKKGKPANTPKLLEAPAPPYPPKARAKKITGMTAVLIKVSRTGNADTTTLYRTSGNDELDQAAVTAARLWKFSPSPSLGVGETIPVVVHVTFSL